MSSSTSFEIYVRMIMEGLKEAGADFGTLDKVIKEYVTTAEKGGKSTESLGQKITKQKPSVLELGTAFGTVTAAGWSLYNAYDGLEKVKAASMRADTKVKASIIAVDTAQKAYNEALKKYGAGSSEAQAASEKLAVAQERLANAHEIAGIKAEDVRESYAQFITTLPTMTLSVANATVKVNNMVKEMGGIHKIGPQVMSALQGVGSAFKAIIMNPIGLVLTAIATVFVLLATNAFGFRDAVNGLGKAIGDALPWLKDFLNLIGGAANWFLNLINPVQEASAQLDTLGTSAGGAGTAMEETQVQVEGLGGALIDQGDVITDVIGFYDSLVAKDAEMAAAYDAFKKAQITGNTEILDSYNLTGEDITKFKEQYEKDMEDARKAAEDAAKESYEAWKKSRDDINNAMKEGYGVLSSYFDSVVSELVTAAEEGMDEFEDVMEKHGISWEHPAIRQAIVKFIVDSGTAEDDVDTFVEFVFRNVQGINTATTGEFASMMTSWAAEMADARPDFGDEAWAIAQEMTADFDKYLNSGYSPGQAFLASVKENLSEDEAKKIGAFFPGVILDTTAATFTADTKVPTAVDSLTAKIDAALGKGLSTLPTTTGTEIGKIGPAITSQSPTIERDASSLTEGVNSIFQTDFAEIPKITDTEFQKVPQAITTSGNKANTESQSMATKVTTNVKKIGTEATATSGVVTKEFGTTIPDAAKKMVTDSKPELDTMVTNTKKFASDMKAELSPIAALFKEVLPNVPQGKSMQKSPSPGYDKDTLIQNAELSPEQIAELFKFPESTPEEVTQNLEFGDYTTQTNALEQFTQFVSKKTTEISAMFLTMKNSITATMTQLQTVLGAFATTAMGTIATAVSTQTTLVSAHFLTMKNSVTITITALQTLLGAFASTTLSTIATAVSTQTTVMSAAFLTMKTSVSTQIIALQTLLGAFTSTTLSTVGAAVTQQTTNMSASFLAMKTSVTASMQAVQTASSTLSTTIATHTASMTTKINSFASAMQTAMDKITKSMDTAKKSADALKKSIDALKDKTITITTRYVTSGSPGGQHGYQGIIGAPGNVGGVKVGEGFRPELITVTPLTRGTGNHYGATMGGGFGSPGGRGGGEVVNNITVVLDGRVIQRFVEKTALAGIGMQI